MKLLSVHRDFGRARNMQLSIRGMQQDSDNRIQPRASTSKSELEVSDERSVSRTKIVTSATRTIIVNEVIYPDVGPGSRWRSTRGHDSTLKRVPHGQRYLPEMRLGTMQYIAFCYQ